MIEPKIKAIIDALFAETPQTTVNDNIINAKKLFVVHGAVLWLTKQVKTFKINKIQYQNVCKIIQEYIYDKEDKIALLWENNKLYVKRTETQSESNNLENSKEHHNLLNSD